jgi:uncharacterized protein (TIGR00369 family)
MKAPDVESVTVSESYNTHDRRSIPQLTGFVATALPNRFLRRHFDSVPGRKWRTSLGDEQNRVNTTTDHGCFGCGVQNDVGLQLAFYRSDEGVVATFSPRPEHEGYTRMTHGGIVSTMLDEAMSWAVIDSGRLAVTARMSVDFRKPVPSGEPVTVVGTVTRDRGRAVETSGEVRDAEGQVLASSTGLFIRVSEEQQREWEETYLIGESG